MTMKQEFIFVIKHLPNFLNQSIIVLVFEIFSRIPCKTDNLVFSQKSWVPHLLPLGSSVVYEILLIRNYLDKFSYEYALLSFYLFGQETKHNHLLQFHKEI